MPADCDTKVKYCVCVCELPPLQTQANKKLLLPLQVVYNRSLNKTKYITFIKLSFLNKYSNESKT